MDEKRFFSVEETNCLKGITAILIMLTHFEAKFLLFSNSNIHYILLLFGYLGVSVFFFLSGFGLVSRYKVLKDKYLNNFLRKRVFSIWILNALLVFISAIVLLINGSSIGIRDFLISFIFGKTIVPNGWYLQTSILYYICFYIIFKTRMKSIVTKINSLSLICICYIALGILFNAGIHWYTSSLGFVLGLYFAEYKNIVIRIVKNRKLCIVSFLLTSILFCIFALVGNYGHYLVTIVVIPELIQILSRLISCVFLLWMIICIMSRFSLDNCVFRTLGKINTGIYLCHGIVLLFVGKYLEQTIMSFCTCLVISLMLAIPFQIVSSKLMLIMKRGFSDV